MLQVYCQTPRGRTSSAAATVIETVTGEAGVKMTGVTVVMTEIAVTTDEGQTEIETDAGVETEVQIEIDTGGGK